MKEAHILEKCTEKLVTGLQLGTDRPLKDCHLTVNAIKILSGQKQLLTEHTNEIDCSNMARCTANTVTNGFKEFNNNNRELVQHLIESITICTRTREST